MARGFTYFFDRNESFRMVNGRAIVLCDRIITALLSSPDNKGDVPQCHTEIYSH